jgi:hypothetical protein
VCFGGSFLGYFNDDGQARRHFSRCKIVVLRRRSVSRFINNDVIRFDHPHPRCEPVS